MHRKRKERSDPSCKPWGRKNRVRGTDEYSGQDIGGKKCWRLESRGSMGAMFDT